MTESVHDVAVSADGLLRAFSEYGVLTWGDVHPAQHVSFLYGETDDRVRLALALTMRALRAGSLCVDLAEVATEGVADADGVSEVPPEAWPEASGWLDAVGASPCVAVGADAPARPFRLVNGLLYAERYHADQDSVRRHLVDRLDRIDIVAGGPGTGKTYRIGRLVADRFAQAASGGRLPLIALAAPTGKAAARVTESLRGHPDIAAILSGETPGVSDAARAAVGRLAASTIHRLLGHVPGRRTRFRHHAHHPLPHDLVIVDEMSMVSMSLMARLVEALKPTARLVLVGDPDQLSSVDAGSVLADLTRGARTASRVQLLTTQHRYSGDLSALAAAIREGRADDAVALLESSADVRLLGEEEALPLLRERCVRQGAALLGAASAGDAPAALAALGTHRLLAGHRHGDYGVTHWTSVVQGWLLDDVPGFALDSEFYLGRPVMVTANLPDLGLFNGDTGVIVAGPDGVRVAAFDAVGHPTLSPYVLTELASVHAMTVHKSQGSQFDTVSLVLPPADSPLLTRELLYTAVTRAKREVLVVGTPEAVRRAVEHEARRTSGLAAALS